MLISISIHVASNDIILFFFMTNIPLYMYKTSSLSIHSSVNEHLDCFHVLAIINSASMSIGVQVSFQIRVFVFPEYMLRNGIAGSFF